MKLPTLLVILTLSLIACDHKQPQYLFPYEWKDSLIDQQLTHDSLVLTFPQPPSCKQWYIEYGVPYDRIGEKYNGNTIPVFNLKNNRVAIAVDIPDSIHTDSLYVFIRAAPADGIRFDWIPGGYIVFGTPRYMQGEDHRQHAHHSTKSGLYWIPDSLLKGEDSTYYNKKLLEFLRDSLWQHDPLPAAPGQI